MLEIRHQIDSSLSNFMAVQGTTFPYLYDSIAMLPALSRRLCNMSLPDGQTALNLHAACDLAKYCEMMVERHIKRELGPVRMATSVNVRIACVHEVLAPGKERLTFFAYRSKYFKDDRENNDVELLGTTTAVVYH